MNQNITVFKDPQELADQVSGWLMDQIAKSNGSRFDLAISGGSTPNLLFSALASKYADSSLWQKTHFWWTDERMVPFYDRESNFGTAQKLLFSKIKIPGKNIHCIHGEVDPLQESENYDHQIQSELPANDGRPRFDLILLGMGEDGHTASIFPNQIDLIQSDRICAVAHHPVTRQLRITLTGSVLNNAAGVWFLVTGSGKAKCVAEIFSLTESSVLLPAACIQPYPGKLSWYMDEPAAQQI